MPGSFVQNAMILSSGSRSFFLSIFFLSAMTIVQVAVVLRSLVTTASETRSRLPATNSFLASRAYPWPEHGTRYVTPAFARTLMTRVSKNSRSSMTVPSRIQRSRQALISASTSP